MAIGVLYMHAMPFNEGRSEWASQSFEPEIKPRDNYKLSEGRQTASSSSVYASVPSDFSQEKAMFYFCLFANEHFVFHAKPLIMAQLQNQFPFPALNYIRPI